MPTTIAAISDIHYSSASTNNGRRRGDFGDVLLLRAVHRLNNLIKPDLVVVLGDCLDDPHAADAVARLTRLKEILDLLECPVIVIPGNHDPEPDVFYSVMERPPLTAEIGSLRVLPFIDPERPGYTAERMPADLERLRSARGSFAGPVVTLQHVPVVPPGTNGCPYSYTNIEELLPLMAEQRVTLSLGGHYHAGTDVLRTSGGASLAVKALCEEPFVFTVITIDGDKVEAVPHSLKMPPQLGLVDSHVHTQFAYCSRGMDIHTSCELAQLMGLSGMVFTEHSGQLYFDERTYWGAKFCRQGIDGAEPAYNRTADYWGATAAVPWQRALVGFEVDADYSGRPVVLPEDRARAQFLVGAVHYLSELRTEQRDPARVADEFLYVTQALVQSGIRVLAHPFRVFRRAKMEVPTELFDPVVRLLRENGVAAELNYHQNTPHPEFVRLCLEAGVRLALGSDSHQQYEVGEFSPHLQLLQDLGCAGNLSEVLIDPWA